MQWLHSALAYRVIQQTQENFLEWYVLFHSFKVPLVSFLLRFKALLSYQDIVRPSNNCLHWSAVRNRMRKRQLCIPITDGENPITTTISEPRGLDPQRSKVTVTLL